MEGLVILGENVHTGIFSLTFGDATHRASMRSRMSHPHEVCSLPQQDLAILRVQVTV